MIPSSAVWDGTVRHVGLEIGTYMGAATGTLRMQLCARATCRSGDASIEEAEDNAVLFVTLDHALPTRAGEPLQWRATHIDGEGPVAVWLAPAPGGRSLEGPGGAIPDAAAHVVLGYAREVRTPGRTAP